MSEEGKNKLLLLGEVSMDVPLEEEYEDNAYFEEPEIKSKSNQIININYLENDNNDNIQILNREEVINHLKQEEAIRKYQIKENENELKRIKQQKQLLKQQQLQMKKLNNSVNKKSSDITKINTNYKKDYAIKLNKTNDEPLIKKKQSQLAQKENEERIKNQNRADILYGSDDEYYKKYYGKKEDKFPVYKKLDNSSSIDKINSTSKIPDISNSEKMFFPNGTLADMPLKKEYSLVDPKTKAIQDRHEKLEQGYKHEPHKLKNIIAVDYIHKPEIKKLATKHTGREAAENLHMSKAEYYMNTDYAKQHLIFNNYLELNSELQPYFKEKIIEQIGEDKLLTTKGIYIDKDSDSSKAMADVIVTNDDFIEKLAENKDKIKNRIPFDISINFTDDNFHNAVGNVDIKDIHINKQGYLDILVADTYDFNEGEKNDLVRVGRERQISGEIIPYFILYHVIIPTKNLKAR